jgi:hypothetical protein
MLEQLESGPYSLGPSAKKSPSSLACRNSLRKCLNTLQYASGCLSKGLAKPSSNKRVSAVSLVRNDWGIVLSQTSLQNSCWHYATATKGQVRRPNCEHPNSSGPPRMHLRRSAIDTRWCISLDGQVEGGPSPPTDTRGASEPQRFLIGQVNCNPILKKGLDLPWALWVSRHHNLLFSPRPPLEPIRKKRHGC